MPTRRYALEPNGPARLEVEFTPPGREVQVRFDGKVIATAANEDALKAEPFVELPDGSIVRLALADPPRVDEPVRVTRNGKPLYPPTDGAPLLLTSSRILYFIAALTAVLSLVALATRSDYLALMRLGYVTLALAGVYALCAFLTSRGVWGALAFATSLFAAEGLLHAVRAVGSEQGAPLWPVILRLFLLVPLGRAVLLLKPVRQRA